jgi:ribosomal protein L11 methyltransferase
MMTDSKSEQNWEQVNLKVDQHLAEGLASLLGEILPGGVVVEKHFGDLFPDELDGYQGPVLLSGYFPAELRGEIQEKVSSLLESVGKNDLLGQVDYSPLQTQNWATAWQERYHPIPIGEKLIIVPTWLENPSPERVPIRIDPGMAFGSGTHPTTQLCLTLLEKSVRASPPGEMLDVGCGSGILSIAGSKLGVKRVLGIDIDPEAVQVADENAQSNGVSSEVSFQAGSVKDHLGLSGADLVVANIIAPILVNLFEEGLGELVVPGGRIILSGILMEQLPQIHSNLQAVDFVMLEEQHLEEWVGLIACKEITS